LYETLEPIASASSLNDNFRINLAWRRRRENISLGLCCMLTFCLDLYPLSTYLVNIGPEEAARNRVRP
jgi:hypothetical protein